MDLSLPADIVAPALLGARLRVGDVVLRLTEVEAYAGTDDPASHAYHGQTPRTAVMFGPAGRLYVYLSYGIHSCVNIVCGPDGEAAAVLLRAGEVVGGEDAVRTRRGDIPFARLASGPGNVGSALGLTVADSGRLIDGETVALIWPDKSPRTAHGPRIGISRAVEVPWRFWVPGEPSVSGRRVATSLSSSVPQNRGRARRATG